MKIIADTDNRQVLIDMEDEYDHVIEINRFEGWLKNANTAVYYMDRKCGDGTLVGNYRNLGDLAPDGKGRQYKIFTEKFNITPVNFKKIYNAAVNKVFIEPIEDLTKEFAFWPTGVNSKIVNKILYNIDEIRKCQKDGLHNILPLVVFSGEAPHELKKKFGKSNWKKLCKNSKTRNKFIAKMIYGEGCFRLGFPEWILDHPTTLLKRGLNGHYNNEVGHWIWKKGYINSPLRSLQKNTNPSRAVHFRMADTVMDTKRMASQLDENFSWDWSWRKMQDKHAEFTRKINEKKYSKDKYTWLKEKNIPETFTDTSDYDRVFTATLLQSPYEIAIEGSMMRHCVGSYARQVADQTYLVYHVETEYKGEKIESTIGIRYMLGVDIKMSCWEYQQMYRTCNGMVSREEEIFGKRLVEHINETWSNG